MKHKLHFDHILLAIILALVALAVCSELRAQTADARVTVQDPVFGDHTYTEALVRLQYSGGLPQQWSLQTTRTSYTGKLVSLTYGPRIQARRGRMVVTAAGQYRATVVYTVGGRIFAAGFE